MRIFLTARAFSGVHALSNSPEYSGHQDAVGGHENAMHTLHGSLLYTGSLRMPHNRRSRAGRQTSSYSAVLKSQRLFALRLSIV